MSSWILAPFLTEVVEASWCYFFENWFLTLSPLGVISHHSVGDAPTNPKFLDFSQFDPYFHLVKSFFIFFCNFFKKNAVKIFFQPKKERFFDKNGQKQCFLTNFGIFCFNFIISMLWGNWRCWKFVPNLSHFLVSATSRLLLKRLCKSGCWSRVQMKA